MSILVKNNIHWVGQRDWEVRDFHGTEYKTLRGSSYNSYLIREEKNVLIDTVDHKFSREFVQNLRGEIDLADTDALAGRRDLLRTGETLAIAQGHDRQGLPRRQHGAMPGSPVGLMQDLVGISAEKWVAGSRFTTLSEKFGATGVEPQIHFLTGVKVLMRDMPIKVFADADQRQTVFQAVQDALDTAIDREDY